MTAEAAEAPVTPDAAPSPHRERLITAMAESVREQGFRSTTVADVVRRARTSRRSFYEHFDDRQSCFLALVDTMNGRLMGAVARAVKPARPWDEQVDRALWTFLSGVADEPELFRSFILELPALGEAGGLREMEVVRQFARLLMSLVDSARRERPRELTGALGMDTAVLLVGGLRELVVIAIAEGRDVRELHPAAAAAVTAVLRDALLGS